MSSNVKALSRQVHTVVNHRRIFTVLATLTATLAATAGILLLLEGQPVTSAGPYLLNLSNVRQNWSSLIQPAVELQNRRWNYIIVYQSGKLSGNAAAISEGKDIGGLIKPLGAGNMIQGAEFHFVVDNANNEIGKPDGYVQQGLAWREQLSSAPYFSWPYISPHHQIAYANAVGVRVLGEIIRANYSSDQVHSLLALVRTLQRRLNIPDSCVKFQWEIQGRPTARERAFSREFHHLLRH